MSDFCKGCSEVHFGHNLEELAGLCEPGYLVDVICECCGPTRVDNLGSCDNRHERECSCGGCSGDGYSLKVVNLRNDDVDIWTRYVGRPTKFGNPFIVGANGTRDVVIKRYTEWFDATIRLDPVFRREFETLIRDVKDRKITKLACWCAPKACHADVIRTKILTAIKKWKK